MMMKQIIYHTPVFEKQILDLLRIQSDSIVLDCTCGEGGHASILLPHIPKGFYYGFDRDPSVLNVAQKRLTSIGSNFSLFPFSYAKSLDVLQENSLKKPTVLLADLGISMYQIKSKNRGFSFQSDDTLNMRFDSDESNVQALDIVNRYPEDKLADIIFYNGEERASRKIAYWIVKERKNKPIMTCNELASIVARAKGQRGSKLHSATKTFQALRIEVNQELKHLDKLLELLPSLLQPKGIAGFISYHSLEDRRIKYFFRNSEFFSALNKKVIKPAIEEIQENTAARSAKFRAGVRCE